MQIFYLKFFLFYIFYITLLYYYIINLFYIKFLCLIFIIIYVSIIFLYARIFCFVYYSRTTDYKSIMLSQNNKSGGSYKPIPPPKPKNYRPPQANLIQPENNGNEGNNTHQHSKSYSIATSHVRKFIIFLNAKIKKNENFLL